MLVIGVDCATKDNKTGMVLASWSNAAPRLEQAAVGSAGVTCAGVLSEWLAREPRALVCLDAPLGWPEGLARELSGHSAGEVLRTPPEEMFSRRTDRRIQERLGKRPFEVGANLIARTAHAALGLLDCLRRETGRFLPLVWAPKNFEGDGAVEVYPAATRIAHGDGKGPAILDGLAHRLEGDLTKLGSNPHVLDAAWCAVAGADFLAGLAEPPAPNELELARGEGWIWVRSDEP